MRILQISSARTLGGGERHFADLSNGLARRGHEVYAAVREDSPLGGELADVAASHVLPLAPRNALDVARAARLARLARRERVEIVHAHLARDYPPAALAARLAGPARLVVTRHVLFPLGRAQRLVLARAARVVAVSGAVERALRTQQLLDEEKLRVVHNGVDVGRLERAAAGAERDACRRRLGVEAALVVGTLGSLSEVKGQDVFLRAAALVAREVPQGAFVLAGEDASRGGEFRARLEGLVAELDLGGRVRLAGRREPVAEFLACLDVFVNASRTESFGLATVEAMACGAAVVATATEGSREIIRDGANGLLVPVGDADALAAAVLRLLRDEPLRTRFREEARRDAHARFGLQRMIEETERVYAEIVSSGQHATRPRQGSQTIAGGKRGL